MRDMLNFKDCVYGLIIFINKLPKRGYKILNKSIIKINGKENL